MRFQRQRAVSIFLVATVLLLCSARADNVTLDTGDEIINLAEPPSSAPAPAFVSLLTSPAGAAAASGSIPVLQLGATVVNRVALVRALKIYLSR